MAQTAKRLPAIRETQVLFLGREDPLEKEMAIHSSTLAWKIPWTEEPDRLQSMGSQRVGHYSLPYYWSFTFSLTFCYYENYSTIILCYISVCVCMYVCVYIRICNLLRIMWPISLIGIQIDLLKVLLLNEVTFHYLQNLDIIETQ